MKRWIIATLLLCLIAIAAPAQALTWAEQGIYEFQNWEDAWRLVWNVIYVDSAHWTYVNGCDGWQLWYAHAGSGWSEGFYQIYGAFGPPGLLRGPIQPRPGFQIMTPWCSWAMSATIAQGAQGWRLVDMAWYGGPGWTASYNQDMGDWFLNPPTMPNEFQLLPFWAIPPIGEVISYTSDWGATTQMEPNGQTTLYDSQTGRLLIVAGPSTFPIIPPDADAENTREYFTKNVARAEWELAVTYPAAWYYVQGRTGVPGLKTALPATVDPYNDNSAARLINDVFFALNLLRAAPAGTVRREMADKYYEPMRKIKWTADEFTRQMDVMIRTGFPAVLGTIPTYPLMPIPQGTTPPPITPYKPYNLGPFPAPVTQAPPPSGPPLTDAQKNDLKVVVNYIDYGHSKGWSDQTICLYICPVIRGSNLGHILQDSAYTGVVSDTLRGFSPGITTNYGSLITTLNNLGQQQLPSQPPQQPGFRLIQELN